MKCELCGIEFNDGVYTYSYSPLTPVPPDKVYTQVCYTAKRTQEIRDEEEEYDLIPINMKKCINKTGKYNPRYRWLESNI